jgi:F-type H+-transporting ATPase subunit delta
VEIRQDGIEVARVYAEALLELAEADGVADEVLQQLDAFGRLLDRVPKLEPLLTNPFVETASKSALIERDLRDRLHDLIVNTLEVMNRKGRLGLARSLIVAYRDAFETARGIQQVRVVSALPLNDRQRDEIARAAARFTGRTPRLVEAVDESLIGGVVLYAGDRKLDASLRRDLEEAEDRLAERASAEMQRGAERYVEEEPAG